MKRIIMLEVDARDDDHLRQVARTAAYGAWSVLADAGASPHTADAELKPLVRVAVTEAATEALLATWDALHDALPPVPPVPPGCRCAYTEVDGVRRYTATDQDCPWHRRLP